MADTQHTVESFLKETSDFDELVRSMEFAEETVGFAAAKQPMLYLKAARVKVQTARSLRRAKAVLDEAESSLAQEIRGRGKQTEGSISEMLSIDPGIQDLRKLVRIAEEKADLGNLLTEAMRHRRDMIRVVSELMIVEGNNPHTEEMRMQSQQKLSEDAREAIKRKKRLARESTDDE